MNMLLQGIAEREYLLNVQHITWFNNIVYMLNRERALAKEESIFISFFLRLKVKRLHLFFY